MERETFKSRLGFILIAAGCAIGLGNVWRFPYIAGQYGGAAFVLPYLGFLLFLGLVSQSVLVQPWDIYMKGTQALLSVHAGSATKLSFQIL